MGTRSIANSIPTTKGHPHAQGVQGVSVAGNIVDLAVAVVIGTAFTALVTKFTDSIITPLINRVGVKQQSDVGILKIGIGAVRPST